MTLASTWMPTHNEHTAATETTRLQNSANKSANRYWLRGVSDQGLFGYDWLETRWVSAILEILSVGNRQLIACAQTWSGSLRFKEGSQQRRLLGSRFALS